MAAPGLALKRASVWVPPPVSASVPTSARSVPPGVSKPIARVLRPAPASLLSVPLLTNLPPTPPALLKSPPMSNWALAWWTKRPVHSMNCPPSQDRLALLLTWPRMMRSPASSCQLLPAATVTGPLPDSPPLAHTMGPPMFTADRGFKLPRNSRRACRSSGAPAATSRRVKSPSISSDWMAAPAALRRASVPPALSLRLPMSGRPPSNTSVPPPFELTLPALKLPCTRWLPTPKFTSPRLWVWLPGKKVWPALPRPAKPMMLPTAPLNCPLCTPQVPRFMKLPASSSTLPWFSNLAPLMLPLPCNWPWLMKTGSSAKVAEPCSPTDPPPRCRLPALMKRAEGCSCTLKPALAVTLGAGMAKALRCPLRSPCTGPTRLGAVRLLPRNTKVWPLPTTGSNKPSTGDGVNACTRVVPPGPRKRPAPDDSRPIADRPVVTRVPWLSRSLCRSAKLALPTLSKPYSSTRPVAVSAAAVATPDSCPW